MRQLTKEVMIDLILVLQFLGRVPVSEVIQVSAVFVVVAPPVITTPLNCSRKSFVWLKSNSEYSCCIVYS